MSPTRQSASAEEKSGTTASGGSGAAGIGEHRPESGEPKHTPGPWQVCRDKLWHGCKFLAVTIDGGKNGFLIAPAETIDDRDEADARLVAAAPDMLAALRAHAEWTAKEDSGPPYPEGMTRDTGGDGIWRKWWDEQVELCDRAQTLTAAAIARAIGSA